VACAATAYAVAFMTVAAAAPYCVSAVGGPRRCIFVDPNECRVEADRIDGACTYQGASLVTRVGTKPFCLSAAPGVLLCIHDDRVTCNEDAALHKGVCVPAPPAPGAPRQVDPFAVNRPY
jgi:hypothetical protein